MIALEYMSVGPGEGHRAGRELLDRMYRQHRGTPMPDIVVGERGKPRFVGDALHFSISHTRAHVFCALSDRPIGIDAEEADRQIGLGLADKILSQAEKVRYAAAGDKRVALLKLWVLKEADAKRTGQGLGGYPNHTDFSPDDPRVRMIDGCFVAVVE